MRRTFRAAAPRLVVVLLAAQIAAPQAMAGPVPADSPNSVAPSAPSGYAKESRKVSKRTTVDLSEVTSRPAAPRPTWNKPMLTVPASAGGTPGGPNGLAPAPLVPGPPPALVTTIVDPATHPPLYTPPSEGLAHGTADTNFEPPDPWVAVGPNHIVQVVNTAIRVTNRQGGHIETAALADFFQIPLDPERFNFDPHVIYDSLHGRWIVSETSFDCLPDYVDAFVGYGYLDIAVSDTADPLGDWTIYWIPFPDVLPDYPMVGTSTDKIAVGSNVFALQPGGPDPCFPDAYVEGAIDVIDWDQIGGDLNYIHVQSTQRSTFRPALQVPATSPAIHAVGQFSSPDGDIHAEYIAITGTAFPDTINVTATDLTAANRIGAFGDPPAPRQPTESTATPNEITNAVDGRPTDALWQNGRLVWVSTIGCTPTSDTIERDCVRISELNTTTAQRRQDFLIGLAGSDIFHGGIGLSMNGALHVTYTRSSLTESPGTHAVYQLRGDPTNAVSPDELLRTGDSPYSLGERWGDFTGVAQDPQDPNVVWQTNEYSNSIGSWGTHVSPLSTAIGGTYFPIDPHRVLNTRNGLGNFNTKFSVNQPRSIAVGGFGPVPADAVAVTGNLTVVGQTGAGHFSLSPVLGNPPTSSIINFPVGDVRANNFTIRLSPNGFIHAWYVAPAGSRSDLVLDVTGYFKANDSGATYNPVPPNRVLDTRIGLGQTGKYQRNNERSFQVTSTTGAVPPGAVAVTGNLTVTKQTASGHVSLTPNPEPFPPTSTINFPVGDNRANGLTIALSATGKISAVYKSSIPGSSTHLIFDVTGYYFPDTTGLRFYPLNPGRRMDTRTTVLTGLTGKFTANTSRVLDTAGFMGVPADASAITGNLTVTQPNKAGHLAVTPSVIVNPPTSTINFPISDTRANGVTQPLDGLGDVAIYFKAASGGTVHAILDVTGYFR